MSRLNDQYKKQMIPGIQAGTEKPGVRTLRREATRQRVLQAALEVFLEKGFDHASTAEMARRAGVAHGTIFTIAPTKERLAMEAWREPLREAGQAGLAAAGEGKGLEEKFLGIFGALFDFYVAHPEMSRVLLKEQMLGEASQQGEDPRDGMVQDFVEGFSAITAAAIASGEIASDVVVPDFVAAVLGIYLLFLLALLGGYYPDRAAHESACRGALRALLRGYSGQPFQVVPSR